MALPLNDLPFSTLPLGNQLSNRTISADWFEPATFLIRRRKPSMFPFSCSNRPEVSKLIAAGYRRSDAPHLAPEQETRETWLPRRYRIRTESVYVGRILGIRITHAWLNEPDPFH